MLNIPRLQLNNIQTSPNKPSTRRKPLIQRWSLQLSEKPIKEKDKEITRSLSISENVTPRIDSPKMAVIQVICIFRDNKEIFYLLEDEIEFRILSKNIKLIYCLEKIRIKYLDDENDLISINNDIDLATALEHTRESGILRLEVNGI